MSSTELTILMPCLNEAETLETCIKKAFQFLAKNSINGEVLIADNGSTDGSQEIAIRNGAQVIAIPEKGYGSALKGGILAAKGKYLIMGDSDDSYDFSSLDYYVEKLRNGYDLVMGNRFKGGIKTGAMPFLHRYLGNPVLSFIGRLFFNSKIGDFHCGLRGFSKEAALKMNLQCTGMEFASEMVVKATLLNLKIGEVPTILWPDGRSRPPHLNTWRDGWRHLRFLLMYSPNWLFLYPGILLMLFGTLFSAAIVSTELIVWQIDFNVQTLLYASTAIIIGFQSVSFYALTKTFGMNSGFLPQDQKFSNVLKYFNLELGLIMGILFILFGLTLTIYAVNLWKMTGFSTLDPLKMFRKVIPATTFLILGMQLLLFSFFYGILGIKKGN